MELITIYEDYKKVMKEFDPVLEQLSEMENGVQEPKILERIIVFKMQLEVLMQQVSEFTPAQEEMDNFNDLRYLVADSYFLAGDVAHLYTHHEGGRAKLRILNYLNKKRRNEFFS